MRSSIHIAIVALAVHAAACSSPSSPATDGRSTTGTARVTTAGHDQVQRLGHAAALLGNGRVLLAGGWDGAAATKSAVIFDPATGQFRQTADLLEARVHATATVLQDGRVLLAGGDDGQGKALATAELYDPVGGTFSGAGPLTTGRTFHTATRLDDGTVVVMGGTGAGGALTAVERYTPAAGAAGTWTPLKPLATARAHHTATLLSTQRILVAGGEDALGAPVADGADGWAERYDPASGGSTTSTGGAMAGRSRHAAALLANGTVLLTGGRDAASDLGTWIIYDPAGAGAFTNGAGTVAPRADATASVLPDGRVVVAGGDQGGTATKEVDVYAADASAATAASTLEEHLSTARAGHAALVLSSGRVLLTGGGSADAETIDRATDAWTGLTPSPYEARFGHTATLLPKGDAAGKVLLVGGRTQATGYLKGWQLWDPASPATLPAPQKLANARAYHTATVLLDGNVLVTGGNAGSQSRNDAELFNGTSWTTLGARMVAARSNHTATLLPSGMVLLTGGTADVDANVVLSSAELYDPVTQSFSATANDMSAPRTHHAATLLRDGRVLIVGGDGLASADVYDPTTNAFSYFGALTAVRGHLTASPLADGRVLFSGGTNGTTELASADLFDGGAAIAAITGAAPAARADHAAALLPSGEPLLAGGEAAGVFLASVDRYDPSSASFLPALRPLGSARDQFTMTQLPSGEILAWGGDNGGLGVYPEIYASFAPATPPPDLAGAPSAAVPTQVLSLGAAGGSFTGVEGADQPLFVLTRQDGDGVAYARTVAFTSTTASVELPAGLPPGWWWLRAIVAGVPGTARPFRMLHPFVIGPLTPTVPPRGSLAFTAAGGSGTGYAWSLTATGSHSDAEATTLPAIDPATGAYVAGATPNSVDTVQCADTLDSTITVKTDVHVGPGISITPAAPWAAAPAQAIAFSAAGGCDPVVYGGGCTGYTWSYLPGGNRSGGTLGADGAYVAGPSGGVFDDVQVTDVLGNHAEASIAVTTPIVIAPTTATVTPLGSQGFTVTGGYAAGGYQWEVVTRGSGTDATIDASGNYQAGRTGSTTDVIRVRDTLGSFAEAVVTVTAGVSITPTAPTTPPGGSLSFTAAGGNAAFTGCPGGSCWTFVTRASGADAVLDASGHYTAGHTPNVTDVIQVQDTLGNVATVSVAVGPGISVSPAEAGAYPNQTVTLTASGGQGSGFHWQLTSTGSGAGAAITPVAGTNTALYTAGPNRGATDLLQVTDDLGNQATADLVVWPDWRPTGSGCSSGGGSGGALALVLMALWLARRGRPRARAASLVRARAARRPVRRLGAGALLLVAAASAQAQTPPVTQSFVVERFQPAGGAFDLLGVQSAQTAGPLQKTFRLYVNYASRPLVLIAPGMHKVALLKSQLAADLTGSVGIGDWAEVSLAVPFMLSQGREQDRYLPPELRQKVASSGLGDPRLTPKVRLLDVGRFRFGLSAPVGLPLGDRKAYLGHGGVTFAPTALAEVDDLGPARLLLNAGAVFRPERRLVDLTVGNAYTYGAGLEYPFTVRESRLAALTTLAGEVGMKHSATSSPMELLGGVRWSSPSGLLVSAGGGPGIGKGYGTPQYRVFLELGYTTAPADRLQQTPQPEPKAEPPKPEPKPEAKPEEPKAEEPKPAEPPKAEEPKPEEPKPEAKPPEPAAEPEVVLRIDAQVFFDFNKKEIKDEYKPLLRRVAKRILSEPRMRVIRIEGHADDLGPPDYNLWLSEERARAVKDFLEKNGVPPSRFAVVGYGKTKPTKPGRSSEARARNRRVEFDVQEY